MPVSIRDTFQLIFVLSMRSISPEFKLTVKFEFYNNNYKNILYNLIYNQMQ